jgi:hypothetical protein
MPHNLSLARKSPTGADADAAAVAAVVAGVAGDAAGAVAVAEAAAGPGVVAVGAEVGRPAIWSPVASVASDSMHGTRRSGATQVGHAQRNERKPTSGL